MKFFNAQHIRKDEQVNIWAALNNNESQQTWKLQAAIKRKNQEGFFLLKRGEVRAAVILLLWRGLKPSGEAAVKSTRRNFHEAAKAVRQE